MEEQKVLKDLESLAKIVIIPANKGLAIVTMDRKDFVQ